jgi:aspartyl-tRNA(Asn)/glutamyl-tRNA(Gln) amidotransferase subunit B
LVGWAELGSFFEESLAAGNGVDPGVLARWTTGELVARLREHGFEDPRESKLSPGALAELVLLVQSRSVSQAAAKDVLAELTRAGGSPAAIVEAQGLAPIADSGELDKIVERAIEQNAAAVEQIRSGKVQAAGAIVGAVMKETKGRADGAEVNRLIRQKLGID